MGLNFEQMDVVKSISRGMLEIVTYQINNEYISEIEDIESEIESMPADDTNALDLDLHDQVDLVVNYGVDYDLSDVRCSPSKLRYEIENYANIILYNLAQELVLKDVSDFKDFYEEGEYETLKEAWNDFN